MASFVNIFLYFFVLSYVLNFDLFINANKNKKVQPKIIDRKHENETSKLKSLNLTNFTVTSLIQNSTNVTVEIHNHSIGEKAVLTCKIDNKTGIFWKKYDGRIKSFYTKTEGNQLLINLLEPSDSGNYSCYNLKGAANNFTILVEDPLKKKDEIKEYYVEIKMNNDDLIMKPDAFNTKICTGITNGSEMEIEWYNNKNELIKEHPVFSYSKLVKRYKPLTLESILMIRNPTSYDIGIYECRVIAGFKNATETFFLNVESDEWYHVPACKMYEATCKNGQCIPKSAVCNEKQDCDDGSDETNCIFIYGPQNEEKCESNERYCKNGTCISKHWICDGEQDCDDNADESFCPRGPEEECRLNEFKCKNNKQCVLNHFLCDGEFDCRDRSDEIGCMEPRIIKGPIRNVSLRVGDQLTLECEAVGFPVPLINWRFNLEQACEETRCKVTNENGKSVLTINYLKTTDSGTYSCEAINSKGRVFSTPDTHVTVKTLGYSNICNCHNHAKFCEDDICINCKHGTIGRNCEYCLPGYYGNARRGTSYDCQTKSFMPMNTCNEDGAFDWSKGYCRCKSGVYGLHCDKCKPNRFYLDPNYHEGCRTCFCSGLNVPCKPSLFYYHKIRSLFDNGTINNDWRVGNSKGMIMAIDFEIKNGTLVLSNVLQPYDENLYFLAPSNFTGNKLGSYGGILSFVLSYECRSSTISVSVLDVLFKSPFGTIRYNKALYLRSNKDYKIIVSIKEENFERVVDSGPVSRETMLMILSKIQAIMIRANLVKFQVKTYLKNFELEFAKETSDHSIAADDQNLALTVEQCLCPIGYEGLSCETCAAGYKRIKSGHFFGLCIKDSECNCNGFSDECDRHGRCLHCKNNTDGNNCEYCLDGFVEDGNLGCRIGIEVDIGAEELEINPNDNYTVIVHINGKVPVKELYWRREDDSRGLLPIGVTQVDYNLQIVDAHPNVTGLYTCQIITELGETTKSLIIRFPDDYGFLPIITFPTSYKVFNSPIGWPFLIQCIAEGYPKPIITIEKDGKPLELNEIIKPDLNPDNGEYTNKAIYNIDSLDYHNSGVYICYAANAYGTVNQTFQINPIQPPPITIKPKITVSPVKASAYEGAYLVIDAKYVGTEPVTVIVERISPTQSPVDYCLFDKTQMKIVFNRVTKDMDGTYGVKAVSPYGMAFSSFELKVKDATKPQIVFPKSYVTIYEGTELQLTPTVSYQGVPYYRWSKDGYDIPSDMALMNGHNLIIHKVYNYHQGEYSLTLIDDVGSTKATVYVTVVKPKHNVNDNTLSISQDIKLELYMGDSISLICDIQKPFRTNILTEIFWYKGNRTEITEFPKNIFSTYDVLHINKVRLEDSGDYCCVMAYNDGSFLTAVVHLRVL